MDAKSQLRTDFKIAIASIFTKDLARVFKNPQVELGLLSDVFSKLLEFRVAFQNGLDNVLRGHSDYATLSATRAADQRFYSVVSDAIEQLPVIAMEGEAAELIREHFRKSVEALVNCICTRLADGIEKCVIGEVEDHGPVVHVRLRRSFKQTNVSPEQLLQAGGGENDIANHVIYCKVLNRLRLSEIQIANRNLLSIFRGFPNFVFDQIRILNCTKTLQYCVEERGEEEIRNILSHDNSKVTVALLGPYALYFDEPVKASSNRSPVRRRLRTRWKVVGAVSLIAAFYWLFTRLPVERQPTSVGNGSTLNTKSSVGIPPTRSMDDMRSRISDSYNKSILHETE